MPAESRLRRFHHCTLAAAAVRASQQFHPAPAPPAADCSCWPHVCPAQIQGIHLTAEQKRILLSLRKLYLQNLGILVRRRQDLSCMLQARPTPVR